MLLALVVIKSTFSTILIKRSSQNLLLKLQAISTFNWNSLMCLRGSLVIKHQSKESYILFIENHFRMPGGRGPTIDTHECQTWALAFLKKDFGRVLIRRETLADKILELVHPVELDFAEDKPFSDTFYVLVNDHHKAVEAINRNFRNAVMDIRHDDFVIEIMEHTLIIGDQKPVSPERAVYLAEFVARLSIMC
jgi:hypothetical protein